MGTALTIGGGALIASLAGLFLAGSGAIHVLFAMMLTAASLALLATTYAAVTERHIA